MDELTCNLNLVQVYANTITLNLFWYEYFNFTFS